jgi:UDP-N-acetylglucosamine--N-acetylmuramyl-(pentapeptide) pyrophosphoryl-undecaprenol N-acetylglucosamine transferase
VAGLGALAGLARLLAEFRPQVVVGTGGYASLGAVLAARLVRIPVLLLEPNAVAGRANRFLSRWADEVDAAWEFDYEPWSETDRRHPFSFRTRLVVTGNPVRTEILALAGEPGQGEGLLVFGGSLGAAPINRAAEEAVPEIARVFPGLPIRHVTGRPDFARVMACYRARGVAVDVQPFLSDMRSAYREAAVVVCRAGGNTLAEVLALGKAAIVVPYPKALDGHQKANALQAAQRGAAVMVEEKELTPVRLAAEVSRLLGDAGARQALGRGARALARPEAARVVADRVLALARTRGGKASNAA